MKKNETIKTKKDFTSFVYKLSQEYQDDPKAWENKDLGSFLKALAAWVDDMEGYYLSLGQKVPENPDWQMIANMFMAAKIYE